MRIGLFCILIIIIGCSHDNKWEQFNKNKKDLNNLGLQLNYIGKDTLSVVGIFTIDSNHIYRLKSDEPNDDVSSLFNLGHYNYYIDSSNNGGRSWSSNKLVFNSNKGIRGFYVTSDHRYKYIVSGTEVYVSSDSNSQFKDLGLKFLYNHERLSSYGLYRNFFNAGKKTVNIFSTISTSTSDLVTIQYFIVDKEKVFDSSYSFLSKSDYPNVNLYCFNDTLFILKGNQNSAKILKVYPSGRLDSLNITNPNVAHKNSKDFFFVGDTGYFIYDTDKYILFFSSDFGYSWKSASLSLPNFSPQYYYSDLKLLYGVDGLTKASYSNPYFFDPASQILSSISTNGFISDSIKSIYGLELHRIAQDFGLSNRFSLLGFDSSQRTSYLFNSELKPLPGFKCLDQYMLVDRPSEISIFLKAKKEFLTNGRYKIELYGANNFDIKENRGYKLLSSEFEPNSDSTIWQASFNPSLINLHKNDKYHLRVFFSDFVNGKFYDLQKQYLPVSFYTKYKAIILAVVVLTVCLAILYIFFPGVLYFLYTKMVFLKTLEKLPAIGGDVFKTANAIFVIPTLVKQSRVLDSWIKSNKKNIVNQYLSEETVKKHLNYVSLPIALDSLTGRQIDKPSPDELSGFFRQKRTSIEILGIGGVGKTTLAVNIGLWGIKSGSRASINKYMMLPIIIEEECDDIFNVIKRKVRGMTGNIIEDEFLMALLKKKRLLIIIDALSERSDEMQKNVKTIYGNFDINALIITSRSKLGIESFDNILIYPKAMNAEKVLDYINDAFSRQNVPELQIELNKARLLEKILSLFSIRDDEVPIIPILIEIVLNRVVEAIKEKNFTQVLNELPSSIPEVYSDYLLRVNPATGQNIYNDEEVLLGSEVIAEASLGFDFVPKDISFSIVSESLKQIDFSSDGDLSQRLIDNGILLKRRYANDNFIRFNLDPLAEYLAAIRKAKNCAQNEDKWRELYKKVLEKKAINFYEVLRIVHITCYQKYSWWFPQDYDKFYLSLSSPA